MAKTDILHVKAIKREDDVIKQDGKVKTMKVIEEISNQRIRQM